ncbi:MAG: FxsA family protein [Desulfuromonadales bacterium]|nr:FxsA family protein [Desulfuromonadales bacterium]NIR33267.1 FxsA family protein [Desulfuromonadales bacterium]NIS42052.1 FxsA family protein [Desulfuromonadales bacterium]
MFIRLLILFTIVPVVEIYILIKVGTTIGAAPTIALIILTGFAGAWLARTQGLDILRRIQISMNAGRMPAEEMIDGAMILAGGVLLLTPGLATDLLGFSLLVPLTRSWLKKWLKLWLGHRIEIVRHR